LELDLQKNEPIHGALARYATEHCISPLRLIHHLLPGTNSNAIALLLPHHLQLLIDHLPPKLGLTPEQLAAQHTFFPAVAPFLETSEANHLLQRMIYGGVVPGYPICHTPLFGDDQPFIRYCPVCAANDRSSMFAVARWRMMHQLFGVEACAEHKCRLIKTGCRFSAQRVFHDAETVIPDNLPKIEPAEPKDIQMTEDLAFLFSPACPRPGRRRIAATLQQRAREWMSYRSPSHQSAEGPLITELINHYGIGWLQRSSLDSGLRISRVMRSKNRIYPAFFSALLGRFLGLPLAELLAAAINVELPLLASQKQCPRLTSNSDVPELRPARRRKFNRYSLCSAQTIESHRHRILKLRRERPNATRREIRFVANYSLQVLFCADPEWIKANLPVAQPSLKINWSRLDAQKAAMVRNAAEMLRSSSDRPTWIQFRTLRKATIGNKWRQPKYLKKLPLLRAALQEERDTPCTYAERTMRWLCREITEGRCIAFAEVRHFLVHAKLDQLARKYPEIPLMAERFLAALSTNKIPRANPANQTAAA
jgi:hypothetical protein